jgi:hypothetical protein
MYCSRCPPFVGFELGWWIRISGTRTPPESGRRSNQSDSGIHVCRVKQPKQTVKYRTIPAGCSEFTRIHPNPTVDRIHQNPVSPTQVWRHNTQGESLFMHAEALLSHGFMGESLMPLYTQRSMSPHVTRTKAWSLFIYTRGSVCLSRGAGRKPVAS